MQPPRARRRCCAFSRVSCHALVLLVDGDDVVTPRLAAAKPAVRRPPRKRKEESAPPAPPSPRSNGTTSDAKLLTVGIGGCATGDELLRFAEEHGASFNAINVSAALSKLAKLQPDKHKHDPRTSALVGLAGAKLGQMGPQALANTIWAVAKLGLRPAWLPLWFSVTQAKLPELAPQGLSNVVYSLALLDAKPSAEWLVELWRVTKAVLTHDTVGRSFCSQQQSNLMYGLGVLRLRPPPDWMAAFMAAQDGAAASDAPHTPQALCNILWGVATLGIAPPAAWLSRFEAATLDQIPTFPAQALSNLLYAFGVLRFRPGGLWMRAFFAASRLRMDSFTPQHCCNIIHALACLCVVPRPRWVAAWCGRMLKLLSSNGGADGGVTLQGVTVCLWALAVLQQYGCSAFAPLWARAEAAAPTLVASEPWASEALHSLYCVHLAALAEAPGFLRRPPAEQLLRAARAEWGAVRARRTAKAVSREHAGVVKALTSLGVAHASEHVCEHTERAIDIVLPVQRVAIEVDGPQHFVMGDGGGVTGASALRCASRERELISSRSLFYSISDARPRSVAERPAAGARGLDRRVPPRAKAVRHNHRRVQP